MKTYIHVSGNSRLEFEQIGAMAEMRISGESVRFLATLFKVNEDTINRYFFDVYLGVLPKHLQTTITLPSKINNEQFQR